MGGRVGRFQFLSSSVAPIKPYIDIVVLFCLPVNPQEYMKSCTAKMKKDIINATSTDAPRVTAISLSLDIASQESIVTGLALSNLHQERHKEFRRKIQLFHKLCCVKHKDILLVL